VLGKALKGVKQPLIVSTKLGGRPQPFKPQDKAGLMASFQESLRLLGRDYIDILMIHEPDRPGQYDWWTDMLNVNGPVLEVMEDLKAKGLVKHFGLGGTTAYEMAHLCRSGKFDVVLTAFNYSLLWREAVNDVIPAAKEKKMGIVVGSPHQQGALARRFDDVINDPKVYWLSKPRREQFRKLYALVDECGLPLPELGIRFVLSNPDVHCVLMGARSAAESEQNVAAADKGALPKALLRKLDEIAAMVPFRPMCEPFHMGGKLRDPFSYKGPGA
jgi:aryl-alcohol dehydrogenase-like predicted oxidoreductase